MINIIKSKDRGNTKTDWLDSKHSYSFADYYDPERTGFGKLFVFNDDLIRGGSGFGFHPHKNAEIVTIVLQGAIKHADSLGNEGVLKEGEVQRISAGKGIIHSEINASKKEMGHFLQIWLETNKVDIDPEYEQKKIEYSKNQFVKIVGESSDKNSLSIHQDATFLINSLDEGKTAEYLIKKKRGIYTFVIFGKINLNNDELIQGDSAEITNENGISIKSLENSKILLIDTLV